MPGGFSQVLPPLAMPAACHASACSGDSAAKPMVPPFANVAGSPLIGFDTENTPVLVK